MRQLTVHNKQIRKCSCADEDEMVQVFQMPKAEGIFIDEELNEISIIGEIKDGYYNDFRILFNQLVDKQLDKKEDYREPIYVYISSIGGDLLQALNIINEIQSAQLEGVTIIHKAGDIVASAGLSIFVSGSLRICNRYTQFLFHQPSGGMRTDQFVHQKRQFEFNNKLWEELKRMTKDNTKVTDEWLDDVFDGVKDYTFFGDETVELGFADLVLQPAKVLDRSGEDEEEVLDEGHAIPDDLY